MKHLLKLAFILGLFAFSANQTQASHIAGADISYECLGQDTFKITISVFRDCSGISAPTNINNSVTISSPCGSVTPNFVLTNPGSPLSNANNGTQVSQLCGSALPNSACSGGPFPGMMQLIFEAVVVLPPCSLWTIGYDVVCCRNTNVNLTNADTYVTTTLNNSTDSCNTGPAFAAQPIPYVCAGQTVYYNFGATEPDGDSLVYSFVAGWNAPGQPNTFQFPYTPTSPLIGATINAKTGEVVFTPTATGNFVVVVEVCEYDPVTKQLLGCTMRDILFVVQICSNQQPNPVAPVTNFSGTGALIDSNSVEVCIGESFTFDVKIWDPNGLDSVSLASNVDSVLPGATFVVSYPNAPTSYDTAVATISWTAVPVNGNFYPFFIEANDNACPIPGIFYATFDVRIINSTYAFPNQTICQNTQQANLEVTGGSKFTWVALPGGDPVVVGPPGVGNFSCDTCQVVQAYPSFTTCYQVTSNLSGTCNNVDTVCVKVAPDYTLATSNDTLICSVAAIQLSTNPSDPTQNYRYSWLPSKNMTGQKTNNPTVNPESTTTYTVTVTSDSGCVKTDDVTVQLSPPFPADNRVLASDTVVCIQDTVNLNVLLGEVTPAKCGPAANACVGNSSNINIGNGTSTNSTFSSFNGNNGLPTPFGGDDNSVRQQFLYRASELTGAGMQGGQVNTITFNVISNNGPPVYNNYEIKMGCTNQNAMTTAWVGGMTTVFNAKPVFPTPGANTFILDTPYDWDGKTNLVVEICYTNATSSQNAIVQHTTTNYASTAYARAAVSVCNSFVQDGQSPINRKPNIQFGICSGVDPNAFTFDWFNSVNVVPPTTSSQQAIDMGVNLTTPTNYSVAIADTYNVCFDTVDFRIHVVQTYDVTPDTAGPFCDISPYYFMSAFTPGGTWSGPGIIDDTLGLFDPGPSGAGIGNHYIKYSITGDACAAIDSSVVTVLPPPDPGIITTGPFCELDSVVLIQGVSPGFISSNVPNIAQGITDSTGFINLAAVPNIYDTLVLTWNAIGPACNNDTIIKFPLTPQFDATIEDPGSFCPHDLPVRLYQTDSISGGTWSGTGITDPKLGVFDPSAYSGGQIATITLDSVGACGNTGTIQIQIDTLPTIDFVFQTGGAGPWCKGDGSNVILEVTPEDDPDDIGIGRWLHLSSWLNGGVNDTTPIVAFSTNALFPKAGTHQSVYSFTDLNGCINNDTIEFVIGENPPNPIGFAERFCAGDLIDGLLVQDSVGPNNNIDTNNTYVWYSDDGLTDSVHTGYYWNSTNLGLDSMNYFVQAISPEGCKSQGVGIVKAWIIPSPNVEFEASTIRGVEPLLVDFTNITNSQSEPPANYWEWYVGGFGVPKDSPYSNDENISYEFNYLEILNPAPGDSGFAAYETFLYGRNEFGCSDTFKITIIIDATSELIIPNIFTPNSDGMNDEFAPTVSGMRMFEGVVYNRWGRKVATLDLSNPTWNGVDPQSDQISDGVYYYVITAEGNNGQEYNEKGTVTLIK